MVVYYKYLLFFKERMIQHAKHQNVTRWSVCKQVVVYIGSRYLTLVYIWRTGFNTCWPIEQKNTTWTWTTTSIDRWFHFYCNPWTVWFRRTESSINDALKVQIACDFRHQIVHVSECYRGSVHDITVLRDWGLLEHVNDSIQIIADKG